MQTAVEVKQGYTKLDMFYRELSLEDGIKIRKEKKTQKRKRLRKQKRLQKLETKQGSELKSCCDVNNNFFIDLI